MSAGRWCLLYVVASPQKSKFSCQNRCGSFQIDWFLPETSLACFFLCLIYVEYVELLDERSLACFFLYMIYVDLRDERSLACFFLFLIYVEWKGKKSIDLETCNISVERNFYNYLIPLKVPVGLWTFESLFGRGFSIVSLLRRSLSPLDFSTFLREPSLGAWWDLNSTQLTHTPPT